MAGEGMRVPLIGQRANPHPSQGKKWEVEVIEHEDGEVCVRYLDASHDIDPWWITEGAWAAWRKGTKE